MAHIQPVQAALDDPYPVIMFMTVTPQVVHRKNEVDVLLRLDRQPMNLLNPYHRLRPA